jgi:hypothetical protein
MIKAIDDFFANARGRKVIAEEMLRLGLRVDPKGRIFASGIEISPAKMGRALGVDRRVVIQTAKSIAEDEKLFQIFSRLCPRAFLGDAAPELGFDVIEIRAEPKMKGVVSAVSSILAKEGIVIRQIISDDPDLFPDPVLTVIIDGKLNEKTISKIKALDFASMISIK